MKGLPAIDRNILGGAALVCLALAVRVWALGWGLPLKYGHIDESVVTFYSMRIAAGVFNPGFYDYPGFFLYLLAGAFRLVPALGPGAFADWGARYAAGDSVVFTWIARGLSVLFASATVALIFQTGRRWGGLIAGGVAAALLALNPLHVLHSHYGTVDALTVLLTFWSMVRLSFFSTDRSRRGAWEAGALVGLAAATKYFPGILVIPLLAVPFLKKDRDAMGLAGIALGGSMIGFALGSPPTWLAVPEFLSRFGHLAPKIVGAPGLSAPLGRTLMGLWVNAGPWAVIAGGVGLYFFLRAGGERRWFAAGWLLVLLFLSLWSIQSDHYALPLYPGLFLMAVEGVQRLARGRKKLTWALWGVLVLSPLPTLTRTLRDLSTPDTRLRAGVWVRTHVPPGARVLRFAHTPEFGPGDPYRVRVDFMSTVLEKALTTDNMTPLEEYDYLIHSEFSANEGPAVQRLSRAFTLVHREEGPRPRFPHHPVVRVYRTRVP